MESKAKMGTGSEPRKMPNLRKNTAGSVPVPFIHRKMGTGSEPRKTPNPQKTPPARCLSPFSFGIRTYWGCPLQLFRNQQADQAGATEVQARGEEHSRGPWRFALSMLVLALVTAGLGENSSVSGQDIDIEYRLKAAYLYKFATYVKWPDGTFADAKSSFVIGILGADPVGADLRKIAAVKKIDGRKIEVRNFKNVKNIQGCQILFISRAVKSERQAAGLKQLAGRNILLVGETRDFLKNGGVMDFVVQENHVKIFISKSAYVRERLEISAKLLRVATVVK